MDLREGSFEIQPKNPEMDFVQEWLVLVHSVLSREVQLELFGESAFPMCLFS